MSNIAHRLRIKFELRSVPQENQIREWVQITESLIRQGHSLEDAGHRAARQTFADCGTMFFKSEADTIATLLAAAKQR